MQMTTLMQAPLTLASIQYIYNKDTGLFTIRIATTDPHGVYGKVKIQLTNVVVVNVNGVANYFNTQLLDFTRTGTTIFETSFKWERANFEAANAMSPASVFTTLRNNGSAITAEVKNTIITIQPTLQNKISFDDRSNYVGTDETFATFTTIQYNKIDENNETITTNNRRCDALQNNSIIDLTGTKIECGVNDFTENTKIILVIK